MTGFSIFTVFGTGLATGALSFSFTSRGDTILLFFDRLYLHENRTIKQKKGVNSNRYRGLNDSSTSTGGWWLRRNPLLLGSKITPPSSFMFASIQVEGVFVFAAGVRLVYDAVWAMD